MTVRFRKCMSVRACERARVVYLQYIFVFNGMQKDHRPKQHVSDGMLTNKSLALLRLPQLFVCMSTSLSIYSVLNLFTLAASI